MSNPFRTPRPDPIDPEGLGEGWTVDDLLKPRALMDRLESNLKWLSHAQRTTREVYQAIFRLVDPRMNRMTEAMPYINEALWDFGFRTVGEKPHPVNPTWKWVEAA